MMTVDIPPGRHVIELTYLPASFVAGITCAVVSGCRASGVGALGAAPLSRNPSFRRPRRCYTLHKAPVIWPIAWSAVFRYQMDPPVNGGRSRPVGVELIETARMISTVSVPPRERWVCEYCPCDQPKDRGSAQ